MKETSLYGRGWGFPPRFSPVSGVDMVADEEDIRQSLLILLSTQLGERIMRQEYGCGLVDFVFENINSELFSKISAQISDSIVRDEPRVTLIEILVEQDSGRPSQLNIVIHYAIRASSTTGELTGSLDTATGIRGFS
ncbi:MAG: GPW/gp25 family protein [Rhodobacteraceae bacterium]|nr:GPW/gp25 family protein [Paracoccaceae bacterium]